MTSKQPDWDTNENPIFGSGMDVGMTQGLLYLYAEYLNEHPIFSSGMDVGMTQGHLFLKHSMPNIKDGCSRCKRPTKDQVTSKQPQWDPYEHPIFHSREVRAKSLTPIFHNGCLSSDPIFS